MAERKVKRRKLTKSAIGDLRDRISLERRSTVYGMSAEPTEQHTVIAEVWAKVETPRADSIIASGDQFHNGVNTNALPDYRFTIRYRADLNSSDIIIRWRGELYHIEDTGIMSPEKRLEYLVIPARLAGDDTKEANQ